MASKRFEHINLFHYYEKSAVYEAFQNHFNRDTYVQQFWSFVFIAFSAGAVFLAGKPEWVWLLGAVFAAERKLASFIDNSNRNWAMHMIDWNEQADNEERT